MIIEQDKNGFLAVNEPVAPDGHCLFVPPPLDLRCADENTWGTKSMRVHVPQKIAGQSLVSDVCSAADKEESRPLRYLTMLAHRLNVYSGASILEHAIDSRILKQNYLASLRGFHVDLNAGAFRVADARSGLAKLIYFHGQPATAGLAKGRVASALNAQTLAIALGLTPMEEINKYFFKHISEACTYETNAADSYRIGSGLTVSERLCLDAMARLQAEVEPNISFSDYFIKWLGREGFDFSDIFPQTFINMLSPSNSMSVKYNSVTKDAQCSRWWKQVEVNQCAVP